MYMRVASLCYTEIHLHSLVGASTCVPIYMNSAGLDAQSERGISKSSAEKKVYMRIDTEVTTCADCLLDNHVVISEQLEKSVKSKQKNVFQKDKATFAGLQKHFLFESFFMIEDTQFDYFVQDTWR